MDFSNIREGLGISLDYFQVYDLVVLGIIMLLVLFDSNIEQLISSSRKRTIGYLLLFLALSIFGRLLVPEASLLSTHLGSIFIHWYAVLIVSGALAAAWLATVEARRRGINPEYVWDMMPWLLVAGIIGARLWHIFTPPASMVAMGLTTEYYLTHPMAAIAIWNGGVGIPGAVAGGALYIYSRAKKVNFGAWADIIAPGLALAQAIGRWGNFLNQEVYGAPSLLPWAITIDPAHRLSEFSNQTTYHPLFLYESLWNLLNMGILLWVNRKFSEKLKTGDIFWIYILIYGVGRSALEFLRLDPSPLAGFNINQSLRLVLVILSAVVLLWRHKFSGPGKKSETEQDEPGENIQTSE
jgi:phosphatidylglycerol:prolipoprotein diacylglycerol transferase